MDSTPSMILLGVAMLLIAYVVALRISVSRLQARCVRLTSERRNAERYLEDSGALIVVLDNHGNIERLNKKCLSLLGVGMTDVVGKDWYDLFVREVERDAIRARFLSLMSGAEGEEGSAEYSVLSSGGQEIHVAWYRRVLRDETGTVSGLLSAGFDVTARKEQEMALAEGALRDELTGLYNLRGFRDVAGQVIRIAERTRHRAFVFFADVDNLKDVNDAHGHPAGDAALTATAKCLTATFRSSDVVARVGGDEFAALAVMPHGESPAEVLERLGERMDTGCQGTGLAAAVRISVGVAEVDPQNPEALETAISAADRSMYAHKRDGREETG